MLAAETGGFLHFPFILLVRFGEFWIDTCFRIWMTEIKYDDAWKTHNLKLDGYDINPVLFPAATFLPANFSLHQLDLFNELPAEVVGAFDVVHVRAFCSLIRHNDPSKALQQMVKMLKPGGWLQWEESDQNSYKAIPPAEGVPTHNCQALLQILDQGGKSQNLINE